MVTRGALETATALLTGAFGAAVAISSIDNGIGWSAAGVDAGTFPFITGAIILAGSIFNLVRGFLQPREVVLAFRGVARVGALFVPAVVYVGLIPFLGIYVGSV